MLYRYRSHAPGRKDAECRDAYNPNDYDLTDMQREISFNSWTLLPLSDEATIRVTLGEATEQGGKKRPRTATRPYEVSSLQLNAIVDANPNTMSWLTIDRRGFSEDHYFDGMHVNILMKFADGSIGRFEPYFSNTVENTKRMEDAVNGALQSKLKDVYVGSTSPLLSFAPQMLTDTDPRKCDKEDLCVVWCLLAAKAVNDANPNTLEEAATAIKASMPCQPWPQDNEAAFKCMPMLTDYARATITALFTPRSVRRRSVRRRGMVTRPRTCRGPAHGCPSSAADS